MDVLSLKRYVDARACHADAGRVEELLDRIIPRPALHARFVNTLARMEYVGVRKMLKSRRAERLDLDGLQHLLDEAVHALRLKKAATALGSMVAVDVATFSDDDTLAGEAGEAYFQALDRRAEAALAALDGAERAETNYLLTSAAIEVRAQAFYPIYERRLRAHGAPFSVSAITKDEDRHLEEMSVRLQQVMDQGRGPERAENRRALEAVLAEEELLFARFLAAAEDAVGAVAAGGERRAVAT
jgi:hypothetical protein